MLPRMYVLSRRLTHDTPRLGAHFAVLDGHKGGLGIPETSKYRGVLVHLTPSKCVVLQPLEAGVTQKGTWGVADHQVPTQVLDVGSVPAEMRDALGGRLLEVTCRDISAGILEHPGYKRWRLG